MFDILFMYNNKNRDLQIPDVITPTSRRVQRSLSFAPAEWPPGFTISQRAVIPPSPHLWAPPHHSGHSSWTLSLPLAVCFRPGPGTLSVCNGFTTSNNYQTAQFPSQLSPLKLLAGKVWTQKFRTIICSTKINIIIFYIKSRSYKPFPIEPLSLGFTYWNLSLSMFKYRLKSHVYNKSFRKGTLIIIIVLYLPSSPCSNLEL